MSTEKRVALYIRVSSEEQARHGYSLAEQEYDLRRYADQHGYNVVGLYADEGASARKALSRRKGLQRLLEDVQTGSIDIIVFKCLDRWFRNVRDYYVVQDILDQHGVLWECSQEKIFNTTTTNGRLMLNLKLSLAQHESDQTGDRIKYVFEGRLREGKAISGRFPIGYRLGEDKRICIDESKVPMVQEMFRFFLLSRNVTSTRKMLKEKYGWHKPHNTVVRLLKSRIYTGEYYGIKNFCPALIDEFTFNRTQKIFEGRTRYPRSGNIYLFTGLMHCPICGKMLSIKSSKVKGVIYIYYFCQAYSQHNCDFPNHLREERVEATLLSSVENELRKYSAGIKKIPHEAKDQVSTLSIEDLRAKQARLKELYVDGLITRDIFDQRHNELDMQITALRPKQDSRPIFLEAVTAEDFRQRYDALDKQARKDFWSRTIDSIRVSEKGFLSPVFYTS